MNIALCDDDLTEIQLVKEVVDEFIAKKQSSCQITLHTFTSADDLLYHIDKHGTFDLLILDIVMPGMNGIELATEIRRKNTMCKIVFLTSSPEFAVKSYKVKAFDYILKPFSKKDLQSLLQKAFCGLEEEKSTSIVIKQSGKISKVQIHTIEYVESIKHIMCFHLKNEIVLSCYATMDEYLDTLLSDKRFVKCHKSFIVNMNYVMSISGKDFIMCDQTVIPISRNEHQRVKSEYINLLFCDGSESI